MTPNELRTAADDLDRLEELEPRPGRVWLADRLRRGAEWLEVPPDGMVDAAYSVLMGNGIHELPIDESDVRRALVAAARWEAPGE